MCDSVRLLFFFSFFFFSFRRALHRFLVILLPASVWKLKLLSALLWADLP